MTFYIFIYIPSPFTSSLKYPILHRVTTGREFKIFYRKGIGVLLEITSGNIKKEKLKVKGLVKSD